MVKMNETQTPKARFNLWIVAIFVTVVLGVLNLLGLASFSMLIVFLPLIIVAAYTLVIIILTLIFVTISVLTGRIKE